MLKELFWNLTFSLHFGVHFAVSSRLAISLLKFGFLGAHVSALRLRAHKAARELVHFFNCTLLVRTFSVLQYLFTRKEINRPTERQERTQYIWAITFSYLHLTSLTNNVPHSPLPPPSITDHREVSITDLQKMSLCST